MMSTSRLPLLAIVLAFAGLTILYTHPLGTSPARFALDLGPDTRLFLWTLAWDTHALVHAPLAIFDANIFHPEPRSLAFSEHQIGSALVAAPIILSTDNVVLGLNLVLLVSCAASGLGTYYLARVLGVSRWGAVVAGVVFALTPPRFFRLGQLHLATVQWIPLTLALLHQYASAGRRRHLLGAVGLFTLQALSGGQSGLFLGLASAALLLYLATMGELRPRSSLARDGALAAVVCLVLNLPFVLPYLAVQRELGLERRLDEAVFWSPNAVSFAASPTHVHRFVLRKLGQERAVLRGAKAYLFPGLVPLLLAIGAFVSSGRAPPSGARPTRGSPTRLLRALDGAVALFAIAAVLIEASGGLRFRLGPLQLSASGGGRAALVALAIFAARVAWFRRSRFAYEVPLLRLRDRFRQWTATRMGIEGSYYVLLSLGTLWASLGPSAGLYAALYRLVPGFDFVRVPSRLTLLSVLGLAVLAGIGADKLVRRSRILVTVALALTLVELAAFPLEAREYDVEIPPMDRWLAKAEPGAIAVFPIPHPRDDLAAARRHSAYMLYSTAHFRPLVNGYSGFTPAGHDRLFRTLATFPTPEGLEALDQLEVRYAVFHRNGYGEPEWEELVAALSRFEERLRLVADFEAGRIYELVGPGPVGALIRRGPPDRGW